MSRTLALIFCLGVTCAAQQATTTQQSPAAAEGIPIPAGDKVKILELVNKSQAIQNQALAAKVRAQEIAEKAATDSAEVNRAIDAAVEEIKGRLGCSKITSELACVPIEKPKGK